MLPVPGRRDANRASTQNRNVRIYNAFYARALAGIVVRPSCLLTNSCRSSAPSSSRMPPFDIVNYVAIQRRRRELSDTAVYSLVYRE